MPPRTGQPAALTLLLLVSGLAGEAIRAQLPDLLLEEVVSGLDSPVAVTQGGDDRLFVTEQEGRIVIVRDGSIVDPPFLDIEPLVGSAQNEQGLLSLAFHPDYAQNGFFFVDYTDTDGDTVLARYTSSSDPDRADPQSARVLLRIQQPFSNHNGGQLQFGPDGMLWVGMGDGGSGNDPSCNAQRQENLLGKILRLDVDQNVGQVPYHGIPADNPFVGQGTFPEEVWAYGLRNPWRFSFDRANGDLFIADVGQNDREEINRQPAASDGGENYGWKMLEGTLCLGSSSGCPGTLPACDSPGYTRPILEYEHGGGHCSVTGGYVYRGASIPDLTGAYLYGDFCSGRLWAAVGSGAVWTPFPLPFTLGQLTSFGEDRDGELLLLSRSGVLYRLASSASPEPGTVELTEDLVSVGEGAGEVSVTVRRSGGADGAVSTAAETVAGTASSGADFGATFLPLEWAHEDASARTVTVPILDDLDLEDDERFRVVLQPPTGGATLGRSETEVEIVDDDAPSGPCIEDDLTLCLGDGRFRVVAHWSTSGGESGSGMARELTRDTGTFWFFDEANVELIVKVLDACTQPVPRFWVFAAGLTNVAVEIDVVDTSRSVLKSYENPVDTPFQPIQDTDGFATCP
jgi:glucose/arabinose dehydrogenase